MKTILKATSRPAIIRHISLLLLFLVIASGAFAFSTAKFPQTRPVISVEALFAETAPEKLGTCFKLLPKEFSYVYDLEDESHEYVKTPEILRKPFKFGRFCWKPSVPEYILTRSFVGGPFADDIEISKVDALSFSMMKDAIGSTMGLVNRNGRAIARFDYDPWGNLRWPGRTKADCHNLTDDFRGYLHRFEITRGFGASQHNPWFFAESFSSELTPYLFAGRRFNSLTGNYYNRNRFYSPASGRFISADPIGFNGDTNLYRYASNNPLRFIDPYGFCTEQLSYEGLNAFDYLYGGAKVGGKVLILSAAVAAVVLTGPEAGLAAAGARGIAGLTAEELLFWGSRAGSSSEAAIPQTLLENANYAQIKFGNTFSKAGKFAGQSIDDVAAALRSGKLNSSDVPIDYIVRDGNTLILNTRSSQALTRAGIPRSQWHTINRTGQAAYEARLTGQLNRNGLTSQGISTVKQSGVR